VGGNAESKGRGNSGDPAQEAPGCPWGVTVAAMLRSWDFCKPGKWTPKLRPLPLSPIGERVPGPKDATFEGLQRLGDGGGLQPGRHNAVGNWGPG